MWETGFGRQLLPGVVLSGCIAAAASVISSRYGVPAMLMGLLLGMACHFLNESPRLHKGLELVAGPALRFGVALLGIRVAFSDLTHLGWQPLVFLACAVGMTIGVGVIGARLMRIDRSFGVLTGGAVAICGASAAMAISSVLPLSEARQKMTLFTVIGVAGLSTVAMIFYPVVGQLLDFSDRDMGFFIGASIHDVAQVVGAGFSVSKEAGNVAVLIKLFRVAMLVPVVLAISWWFSEVKSSTPNTHRLPRVPIFLLGFIALFCLNSTVALPSAMVTTLSHSASILLLMAISALGVRTSLKEVMGIGPRPMILLVMETLFLALLVIAFLNYA